MNVCAVIAEYNPLHQGHASQIRQIRQRLGDDCGLIIVMSGAFVQRGEPALLDKWTRTRMALAADANLVLELPALYATGSAEWFAEGGIRILAATGLTGTLAFGAETPDMVRLQELAMLLEPETEAFQTVLREGLGEGLSFAAARLRAIQEIDGTSGLAELLDQPNNILAVEYLKALRRLRQASAVPTSGRQEQTAGRQTDQIFSAHMSWQPMVLPRVGQSDRERTVPLSGDVQLSATAIRQLLRLQKDQPDFDRLAAKSAFERLTGQIPARVLAELMLAVQEGCGPVFFDHLTVPVLAMLRSRTAAELADFAGMGDGVAERLVRAARLFPQERACEWASGQTDMPDQLEQLMQTADSKRHTRTRLQRAVIAALLGIRRADLDLSRDAGGPRYLRVLGFDRRGRHLLALMRRLATVPVITRASDFLEHAADPVLTRQAELDLIAQDIWSAAAGNRLGRDFDTPPVMR